MALDEDSEGWAVAVSGGDDRFTEAGFAGSWADAAITARYLCYNYYAGKGIRLHAHTIFLVEQRLNTLEAERDQLRRTIAALMENPPGA